MQEVQREASQIWRPYCEVECNTEGRGRDVLENMESQGSLPWESQKRSTTRQVLGPALTNRTRVNDPNVELQQLTHQSVDEEKIIT